MKRGQNSIHSNKRKGERNMSKGELISRVLIVVGTLSLALLRTWKLKGEVETYWAETSTPPKQS